MAYIILTLRHQFFKRDKRFPGTQFIKDIWGVVSFIRGFEVLRILSLYDFSNFPTLKKYMSTLVAV